MSDCSAVSAALHHFQRASTDGKKYKQKGLEHRFEGEYNKKEQMFLKDYVERDIKRYAKNGAKTTQKSDRRNVENMTRNKGVP